MRSARRKRNLSSLSLRQIPEDVLCQGQQLAILDLSDNPELQLVGNEVCRLPNLRELAACRCGMQQLPSELMSLTKLTSLDLQSNKLSVLPSSIWSLPQLKTLNLSGNSLATLPELDSPQQSLVSLDASNNCLVELPTLIHLLQSLKTLDLGCNSLHSFPDDMWQLKQLESLSIRKNAFKRLPTGWWRQLTLTTWDASNNSLSSLPGDMWKMPALKALDVSGNPKLTKVHVHLIFHERLTELAIDTPQSGTFCGLSGKFSLLDLRRFNGDFLWHLDAVKRLKAWLTLNLESNQLELSMHNHGLAKLDDDSVDDISSLATLIAVDLSGNDMENIPHMLWSPREIEHVNLSGNKSLQSIPAELCTLAALKGLDASCCNLSTLPSALGQLSKLEVLQIGDNAQLQMLPPVVFAVSASLRELGIGGCGLKALPNEVSQLIHLRALDVSCNELSTLPAALGSLQNLEVLCAGNNNLSTFPDAVLALSRLVILDLSNKRRERFAVSNWFSIGGHAAYGQKIFLKDFPYPIVFDDFPNPPGHQLIHHVIHDHSCSNSITELPVNVLHLAKLESLDLGCNPMVLPPAEICDQGVAAVRAYLIGISAGRSTLYVATFSLLGETGAGKTSLVRSLKLGKPYTTELEDRTRVMEQHHLCLSRGADNSSSSDGLGLIVFNDFGGHVIYQTVLPVLLPPRGVALLVYDVTQPEAERTVEKWLTTTLAAVPGMRLLIVGTHCDQLPPLAATAHVERMVSFYHKKMVAVQEEIEAHIREVKREICRCLADKYPATAGALLQKHEKLQRSLDFLHSTVAAAVPPLVVSCRPRNSVESERLDELRETLANLVTAPTILPASWCRLIKELLEPTDDAIKKASYLTIATVEGMFDKHFPSVGDRNILKSILVYMTETSQVIWLKDHPELSTVVFHRIDHVIEIIKAVLCHDNLSAWDRQRSTGCADDVAEYKEGFLSERLLHKLLTPVVSADCDVSSLVKLLVEFRLISPINLKVRVPTYIISSKLPEEPPSTDKSIKRCRHDSVNGRVRVHAQLSFFGSIVPLAFFETSIAVVLQHADQANVATQASCWRDGVFFRRDGVQITCQRVSDAVVKHGLAFDIQAQAPDIRCLWSVAEPLFRTLAMHLTTAWKGAWYDLLFLCPACEHGGCTATDVGTFRFELDYDILENFLQSSKDRGTGRANRLYFDSFLDGRCRDEYATCPRCDIDIPYCLLAVCPRDSVTDEEVKQVGMFLDGQEKAAKGDEYVRFHKLIDNTISCDHVKHLLQECNGVGMICSPELRATGFRIGSRYLLTAKHVVEKIVGEGHSLPCNFPDGGFKRSQRLVTSCEREVFVVFKYVKSLSAVHDSLVSEDTFSMISLTQRQWQEAGLMIMTFSGAFVLLEGMDAAVLELAMGHCSCGTGCDSCIPPPLHCATDDLSFLSQAEWVHVIGHPDGKPLHLDLHCKVIQLSPESRLRFQSLGSASMADVNLLLYECTLYEGASGAPVLGLLPVRQQLAVVAMHVCGFPDAAAKFSRLSPNDPTPSKRKKPCQGGVRLDAIFRCLKEHHPHVYDAIWTCLPKPT